MKGQVLIIDDSELDIRIINLVLLREGFDCYGFTDHQKGLDWCLENHPQLIFLDIQMPQISGYDMIPLLKAMPNAVTTPIIMVSGKNDVTDVRRAIQAGASDYIIKPVDPLVLQEKIRKSNLRR